MAAASRRSALRDRAVALGVARSGHVPRPDPDRGRAGGDRGAPTSVWRRPAGSDFTDYSLSTKAFEYAAMGRTVVASRLPMVERVFGDAVVTYEPGNAASLADALIRIVDEPAEREARLARALDRIGDLSWEHESVAVPRPRRAAGGRTGDDGRRVGPPVAGGEKAGFRPDIEGLRAVAVVLVVLYHAGVPGFGGGYVGVDVFFVISGFLITGLLLRELDATGGISLARFYARRARRLLPAVALVIVVTLVASVAAAAAAPRRATSRPTRRGRRLYVANFRFALQATDYFAADARALAAPALLVARRRGAVLPVLAGAAAARRLALAAAARPRAERRRACASAWWRRSSSSPRSCSRCG